jgi:uncharacterized protein YndB with AHSA1/START domain
MAIGGGGRVRKQKASNNTTVVDLPIDEAFDLVTDASSYPEWLVGAQEIRHVDAGWPAVGTSFAHRIGFGPVRVPGSTTVRELERPNRFVLAAGMGPLGEATVRFELRPSGTGTEVTVLERPAAGLARLGWNIARPVLFLVLWGRNEVSLSKLAGLVDRNAVSR